MKGNSKIYCKLFLIKNSLFVLEKVKFVHRIKEQQPKVLIFLTLYLFDQIKLNTNDHGFEIK